MFDKKKFAKLRKEISLMDQQRELMIIESRKVLKLSKQVIYSVHRDDLKEAAMLIGKMKTEFEKLLLITKANPELDYSGVFRVASQEYTEAICFHELVTERKIPFPEAMGVNVEYYLLGLCDLSGEIVRKAINAARKEDYGLVVFLHSAMESMYGEFLKMDMRNGELRKKFDSMKYDIKKLDGLLLDLKLKDKLK